MEQAVLETLELNKISSFTYGEILLNFPYRLFWE